MDNSMKAQSTAQKGAQKYFTKTGQDDTLAKQARKKERTTSANKTAKLRELRLAKEASDKEAAEKLAAGAPPARKKRAPAVKPAGMVRMTY